MLVKHRPTGQLGNIPDDKFDPTLFEQVQPQKMSINTAVKNPPQKDGIVKSIAKAIVKPGVDFAKLAMGTSFEGARAIDAAMGNKNAYDVNKGAKNPFLSREEIQKDYSTPQDIALNAAKKTAAAGSYFVPGGAGLGGAVKAGAAAGGLLGFGESKKKDLEGMAIDTALGAGTGAATGAVLHGIGAGIKKFKGAGDAARKAVVKPQTTPDPFMAEQEDAIMKTLGDNGLTGSAESQKQQMPEVFRKISANIKDKLATSKGTMTSGDVRKYIEEQLNNNINFDESIPQMASTKEKLIRELLKKVSDTGVTNADDIAKAASKYMTPGENAAMSGVRMGMSPMELAKQGVTLADIQKAQQRMSGLGLLADLDNALKSGDNETVKKIAEHISSLPADSPYASYLPSIQKFAEKAGYQPNTVPAQTLFEFKQNLGNKLGNVFKKLEKGTPLTDKEEVALTMWHAMDDLITKAEPTVKDMTRAQSYLYKAMPGIAKQSNASLTLPVIGKIPGAQIAQGAQDAAGRVLQKAGNIGGKAVDALEPAAIKGTTLALNGAMNNGEPTPPTDNTPMLQQQDVLSGNTGQPQEQAPAQTQAPNGLDMSDEKMVVAMMQYDLQTTGGKNIPEIKSMFDVATAQKKATTPTATQAKRLTALDQAAGIYDMVEQLALNAGTGLGAYAKSKVGTLPGVEGGAEEDLSRVTQALAKGLAGALANEVGVATDKDIERWMGLMPKVTDTMEERQRALQRLKSEIIRAKNHIQSTPEADTTTQ